MSGLGPKKMPCSMIVTYASIIPEPELFQSNEKMKAIILWQLLSARSSIFGSPVRKNAVLWTTKTGHIAEILHALYDFVTSLFSSRF